MHLMEQKIRDVFVVNDAWDSSMANQDFSDWHIDGFEATKVGPVNNARPKKEAIQEEEIDYVDPYDFDMDPILMSSGDNHMSDSSNIYQSSMMTSSMLNTPLMNDKLARNRS